MSTYWKCDAEANAKILELVKSLNANRKAWYAFSKSIGASPTKVVTSQFMGRNRVVGFLFKKPPEKGFRKSKCGEFWIPRSGTAAAKAMLRFQDCLIADVCKLLGIEMFNELKWSTPGIREKDGEFYIVTGDVAPKDHCSRISDLEFEALFPTKKKASRKKPKGDAGEVV